MVETDRYGNPIVKASADKIYSDLVKLKSEALIVLASELAASCMAEQWDELFPRMYAELKEKGLTNE